MIEHEWVKYFAGAVVVCDPKGIMLEMNDRAIRIYRKDGGEKLIGSNIFDCHPGQSRTKLKEVMDKREPYAYSIEMRGVKSLVYLAPWHISGEYRGFVQVILTLPIDMPQYVRDKK